MDGEHSIRYHCFHVTTERSAMEHYHNGSASRSRLAILIASIAIEGTTHHGLNF